MAAALAARKKTLDRQTVMAILGLVVVAAVMVVDLKDFGRSLDGIVQILPWLVGLSIAIFVLNRWTFAIQAKALRRDFRQAGGA
ncbi:hypothetical protein [Chenggangzhangella methanolivorans]|uniref:Uncharacterized protein n=1 Tax=Chenggangzhangella methanolivorans TaxID=1437009 RepID=A0A9E6R556_9HYPH|nr:hypothetical protein [Chenggangzhangella methanolivorans]QZN98390.1 hypothetical protein K6K41_14895 [Chenggangzhangella methanolivorans]